MKKVSHPYHYAEDKSIIQRLIDFGVPFVLFLIYLQFYNFSGDKISSFAYPQESFAYNFSQFSPKETVKTTGLLAIALLSLTLLIGPASRFFPALNILKAHRKFWGVLSFFIALTHAALIYIFYANYNLFKLFNPTSPKYLGLLAGLASLVILLTVTLTSNKLALNSLSPKVWKVVQSMSYLALILAVLHFYLVESKNGSLIMKNAMDQITFGLASLVIIIRLLIVFLPSKK